MSQDWRRGAPLPVTPRTQARWVRDYLAVTGGCHSRTELDVSGALTVCRSRFVGRPIRRERQDLADWGSWRTPGFLAWGICPCARTERRISAGQHAIRASLQGLAARSAHEKKEPARTCRASPSNPLPLHLPASAGAAPAPLRTEAAAAQPRRAAPTHCDRRAKRGRGAEGRGTGAPPGSAAAPHLAVTVRDAAEISALPSTLRPSRSRARRGCAASRGPGVGAFRPPPSRFPQCADYS
jgi:hypothetical protein